MSAWFTIGELAAARLPTMTQARLKGLVQRFGDLPPHRARTRERNGTLEAEFNIEMFSAQEQKGLLERYRGASVEERIARLGIGWPVAPAFEEHDLILEGFAELFEFPRQEGEALSSWRRRLVGYINSLGRFPQVAPC